MKTPKSLPLRTLSRCLVLLSLLGLFFGGTAFLFTALRPECKEGSISKCLELPTKTEVQNLFGGDFFEDVCLKGVNLSAQQCNDNSLVKLKFTPKTETNYFVPAKTEQELAMFLKRTNIVEVCASDKPGDYSVTIGSGANTVTISACEGGCNINASSGFDYCLSDDTSKTLRLDNGASFGGGTASLPSVDWGGNMSRVESVWNWWGL